MKILCKRVGENYCIPNGFFHLSEELHYLMMAKSEKGSYIV